MIYTLYIAILIIVLTVHEYGHLLSAQIMGIRTARLQIGLGPSLLTAFTGRTRYLVAAGVPPPPEDMPVEFISVWQGEDQPMTLVAWRYHEPLLHRFRRIKTSKNRPVTPSHWTNPPKGSLCQSGRTREVSAGEAIISTMAWSVAPIPLAAYVSLPESPHGDVPHCFNTTSWLNKTTIALTGVAANIALFMVVILVMPLVGNPMTPDQRAVTVPHGESAAAPYHQRVTDTTIRYYRGFEAATRTILSGNTPEDYPDEFEEPRPVCGPICAGELTGTAVQLAGFYGWLAVLAMFTIFAAFLNILPFPPLDGWKVVLNTAQALRRRPFNPSTTLAIELIAVSAIACIIIGTVFLDLHHHLT